GEECLWYHPDRPNPHKRHLKPFRPISNTDQCLRKCWPRATITRRIGKKRIWVERKNTRQDIAVSVFHAEVPVVDFHSTIASVIRPADRSKYNFENQLSTPGPNGGLRKIRPTQGCTRPLS